MAAREKVASPPYISSIFRAPPLYVYLARGRENWRGINIFIKPDEKADGTPSWWFERFALSRRTRRALHRNLPRLPLAAAYFFSPYRLCSPASYAQNAAHAHRARRRYGAAGGVNNARASWRARAQRDGRKDDVAPARALAYIIIINGVAR